MASQQVGWVLGSRTAQDHVLFGCGEIKGGLLDFVVALTEATRAGNDAVCTLQTFTTFWVNFWQNFSNVHKKIGIPYPR